MKEIINEIINDLNVDINAQSSTVIFSNANGNKTITIPFEDFSNPEKPTYYVGTVLAGIALGKTLCDLR